MDELLMCSVCIERYHEHDRHPVLLPRCGHSFCRPCIAMLTSGGCILCPTCRTDQRIEAAERLPTEYTLLAIISAQENFKKETCDRHCVKLSFWCRTCEKSTCGECLFEDHPTHSHDVIKANTYITNMKQHANDIACKFLDVLDDREQSFYKSIYNSTRRISTALRNISVLRKDMDEAYDVMKRVKEEDSISSVTSLAEAAKFLGLKWNIQDANFSRTEKVDKQLSKEDKIIDHTKEEGIKKPVNEEKDTEKNSSKEISESKNETEKATDKPEASKVDESVKSVAENKNEINYLKSSQKNDSEEIKSISKEESDLDREIREQEEIIRRLKEGKDVKRLLRKSKTLSSVEVVKGSTNKFVTEIETKVESESKAVGKEASSFTEEKSDLGTIRPRGRLARKAMAAKKALEEEKELEIKDVAEKVIMVETTENISNILEVKDEIGDKSKSTDSEKVDQSNLPKNDSENQYRATEDKSKAEDEEDKNADSDSGLAEDSRSNKLSDDKGEKIPAEGKLIDFLQVPGFMVAIEGAGGRLARVDWGPQGLHVFCHQFQELHYDIVIKSTLLLSLIPSKCPIVFLELSADQTLLGRIYIQLWGHLRRAHNFLALCIGDQGSTYMNTKFLQVYNVGSPGERMLGGDYEYDNGRGGRELLPNMEWNSDYAMPMKAGMVTAAGSGQSATNSLFLMCTQSDLSRNFSCPFGQICEGMKVVKEALMQTATKQVWISDCGVLLVPPRL